MTEMLSNSGATEPLAHTSPHLVIATQTPAHFVFSPVDDPVVLNSPTIPAADAVPPLGDIADFVGTWAGSGFNTIFRPKSAGTDNILELNLTAETLSFSASLGAVPNRGMLQGDIMLNGIPYLQTINDMTTPGAPVGIHVEPGLWMAVPATAQPPVPGLSYTRMASIPHGTTIELQGTARTFAGPPTIPAVDITPTSNGNRIPFPSQTAASVSPDRIPQDLSTFIAAGTITQEILDDPNSVLRAQIAGQMVISTTEITLSSAPPAPLFGGGVDNIAFLLGDAQSQKPNAAAVKVNATFWIEIIQHTHSDGTTSISKQIQYSQTVILSFNTLDWPHVSVATLVPASPPASVFQEVASASVSDTFHVVGINTGQLLHTFRNAAGTWQTSFGLIESQESNDPGRFTSAACAGVGDTLHVVGVARGHLWHTFRNADGSWQPFFGSIESQESNNPGAFTAVSCTGSASTLQVVGVAAGGLLWQTLRNADGSWQSSFAQISS